MNQISYCGIADVIGSGNTNLSEEEIRVGLSLEWYDLDQAIVICEADEPFQDQGQPDNYEGRFIKNRDLIFLKEAKKILS